MNPLEMVCDYSRSYVTFVTKGRGNLARLQVESRCIVLDGEGNAIDEFFYFASCKSEDTYAKENLFYENNYDFSGIFSREQYVIFRAGISHPDQYAERGTVAERFEAALFQIRPAQGVRKLEDNPAIVQATLAGLPLVGRTEIADAAGKRRAVLEYPVKTMNVQDGQNIYQVDTGPLPFPDFAAEADSVLGQLELAYVAHNRPDEAYFILQRRQPINHEGREISQVCHYSDIRRMPSKNGLLSVGA